MTFAWDETKHESNLAKHGLDFLDAEAVFDGPTFTFEDDRFDYEQERFITLGILRGVVVAIAHTEQNDIVRVISMRKARKYEQKIYFERFANRLGTN